MKRFIYVNDSIELFDHGGMRGRALWAPVLLRSAGGGGRAGAAGRNPSVRARPMGTGVRPAAAGRLYFRMPNHPFRLVNVFTRNGGALTGNPLCVFENGAGFDSATMQALARQFNLSETTFIFASSRADASVRIFTPTTRCRLQAIPPWERLTSAARSVSGAMRCAWTCRRG